MGWTIEQWAGLGVRYDGEPMSAEEMAYEDDDLDDLDDLDDEIEGQS